MQKVKYFQIQRIDRLICQNCGKEYSISNFGFNVPNAAFNEIYCDLCCDEYITKTFKVPVDLANVQRLIIAGKRQLKKKI